MCVLGLVGVKPASRTGYFGSVAARQASLRSCFWSVASTVVVLTVGLGCVFVVERTLVVAQLRDAARCLLLDCKGRERWEAG